MSIAKFVGAGVALFVIALGFLVFDQGQELAALLGAFGAMPALNRLAWLVVVLMPLVLLPAAVWLTDTLVRQRKAAQALELRLDGVRQGVREVAKSQVDADAAVHHLARTDPEDAIATVQQRLTEAEQFALTQQMRNEAIDLQSRVEAMRAQQQVLRERLSPVLEKRRAIEQMFADLDSRQNDIERVLAEIASGDDAVALEVGLKKLGEFLAQSHARCDDMERALQTIGGLKDGFVTLRARIVPLAAADNGVISRVKELKDARDRLAAEIELLAQVPDGDLGAQVQKFAESRRSLEGRFAQLKDQFSTLGTLRQDVDGLFAGLAGVLAVAANDHGEAAAADPADMSSRLEELSRFVKETAARFADIEQQMIVSGQLQAKLGELRTRLAPIGSPSGGALSLIRELDQTREHITGTLAAIEQHQDGGLAERVKASADAKRELEDRVSSAAGHFSSIEQHLAVFGQLRTKLGDLQARLVPIESPEGGVASLIAELQQTRDRLTAKLAQVEQHDGNELSAHVKTFAEAKRELEERVSIATEHFSKLHSIRKDIAGLFEKLGSAVGPS